MSTPPGRRVQSTRGPPPPSWGGCQGNSSKRSRACRTPPGGRSRSAKWRSTRHTRQSSWRRRKGSSVAVPSGTAYNGPLLAQIVVQRLTMRRPSRTAYRCFTRDPPRSQGNRREESSTTAGVGQEVDRREAKVPSISSSSSRTSPGAPPRLLTAMAAVPWAASADAIGPRETGPPKKSEEPHPWAGHEVGEEGGRTPDTRSRRCPTS